MPKGGDKAEQEKGWKESYPSAAMQSVYSTAPADWAW